MEFLGVGPMELILILVIALIILGPNDMVKAGRTLGRFMRRIVKSPMWAAIQDTSRGLRTLPNRLMREAGLEEEIQDIKQTQDELRQQVSEVMKVKGTLASSVSALGREIDGEARTIGKEAHAIDSELSAWTTTPASPPTAGAAGAGQPTAGLGAWVTPPQPDEPAAPTLPAAPAEPPSEPSSPES